MTQILTPSHLHMLSVKNHQGRPALDPFSKTKAFCFVILHTLDTPNACLFPYPVLCVMQLWATYFQILTTRRLTPIQHFYGLSPMVSCLHHILGFSPEGGVCPYLLFPFRHVLFMPCNREPQFGHCPILLSSPSNTKHQTLSISYPQHILYLFSLPLSSRDSLNHLSASMKMDLSFLLEVWGILEVGFIQMSSRYLYEHEEETFPAIFESSQLYPQTFRLS